MGKIAGAESRGLVAWSPVVKYGTLLASGSVAGAMDAAFSEESLLEIRLLDLASSELKVVGKVEVSQSFHQVSWGFHGISDKFEYGLVAGGMENGALCVWDPKLVMESNSSAVVFSNEKEAKGSPILGLDFNPTQPNLLASGASASELNIWDLNSPESPSVYNPVNSAQQNCDITALQWNRHHTVPYILGVANSLGGVEIWNLKSRKSIIKFRTDRRCRCLAWNPDNPTEIAVGIEDDSHPVVQIWDLRNASAGPVEELSGHTKGILDLSWCPHDSSLLVSCGKDNRACVWEPGRRDAPKPGRLISELPVSDNWNFDVNWSPMIPAVLSLGSFDGQMTVYGLHDGRGKARAKDETFGINQEEEKEDFSRAPKWLQRPVGASFGFGGKLTSFDNSSKDLKIRQVVTDEKFLDQTEKLEKTLRDEDSEAYVKFCDDRIANAPSKEDWEIWSVLRILHLKQKARSALREHLGFDPKDLEKEVASYLEKIGDESKPETSSVATEVVPDGEYENVLQKSLLIADFKSAVEVCMQNGRLADALLLATCGGDELWKDVRDRYFEKQTHRVMKIVAGIVTHDLSQLVKHSDVERWDETLALILQYAEKSEFPDLCDMLGERLLENGKTEQAERCFVCAASVQKLVAMWVERLKSGDRGSSQLQDIVEKISLLRLAVRDRKASPLLGDLGVQYSSLLAQEGQLNRAMFYLDQLSSSGDDLVDVADLRARLSAALAVRVVPQPKSSNKPKPATVQSPTGSPMVARPGQQQPMPLTVSGMQPQMPQQQVGPPQPQRVAPSLMVPQPMVTSAPVAVDPQPTAQQRMPLMAPPPVARGMGMVGPSSAVGVPPPFGQIPAPQSSPIRMMPQPTTYSPVSRPDSVGMMAPPPAVGPVGMVAAPSASLTTSPRPVSKPGQPLYSPQQPVPMVPTYGSPAGATTVSAPTPEPARAPAPEEAREPREKPFRPTYEKQSPTLNAGELDLSKIPELDLSIVISLQALTNELCEKGSPVQTRKAEGAKAKLERLYGMLMTGELGPDVLDELRKLATAIQERNFQAARQIQTGMTRRFAGDHGHWLTGTLLLLQTAKHVLKE